MRERRLLFFFDGTSNSIGSPTLTHPTNIFRLIRAFTFGFKDTPQISFYFSGVGTRGDRVSAVTGRGFDEIVAEGYVNLASNYMDNDSIYIFGFSRGAAAARALTGLLTDPGLIGADSLAVFPDVWRYFLSDPAVNARTRRTIRDRFNDKLFKKSPRVKFMGVFDTVSGTDWDLLNLFTKVRFKNLSLDKSVNAATHILSIDDDRVPSFTPLLWERSNHEQIMEQVWLPGVHADIGGSSEGEVIGNVALLTMLDRVRTHCPELELDEDYIESVREELRNAASVSISSERSGLKRKFLRRGRRIVGATSTESRGRLLELLSGREFAIKGRKKFYAPEGMPVLPLLATREDRLFEEVVERILGPRL
ncbi:T6SS phospholipase effector Tle1-like catalytic domain-containing protein [Methylobacterium fujisawaense]|jgi:uncharacterized protein (DUF2235 family)